MVLYSFLVFSFFLKVPQLFLISTHLEMVLTRSTDSVCKIFYLRDFLVLRTTSPPVVKILIFKRKCCLVWLYRKGTIKTLTGESISDSVSGSEILSSSTPLLTSSSEEPSSEWGLNSSSKEDEEIQLISKPTKIDKKQLRYTSIHYLIKNN